MLRAVIHAHLFCKWLQESQYHRQLDEYLYVNSAEFETLLQNVILQDNISSTSILIDSYPVHHLQPHGKLIAMCIEMGAWESLTISLMKGCPLPIITTKIPKKADDILKLMSG
jgi:hypothetical protein